MANIFGGIPSQILELSKLVSLDLSENQLTLHKPTLKDLVEKLTHLSELHLRDVDISSHVPHSLSNLTSLTSLILRNCSLQGEFPPAIFQLPYLLVLQLSLNPYLMGYLPEFQLGSPLDIHILGLNGCNLIEFPAFLRGQNQLEALSLTNNNIKGYVPNWIFTLESLLILDLSYNFLTHFEHSPNNHTLPWNNLSMLNLEDNELEGPLPVPPPSIVYYDVSKNKFNGEVSPLFCNLTSLLVFDLSENNLSGNLPSCLAKLGTSALVLNLRKNMFSGKIPDNFTTGCALKMMDFNQNKIIGEVPRSLTNCSKLEILNLEKNDVFPSWLGFLPRLRILSLKSNKLHGEIGQTLSKIEFNGLQIIDLSDNNFTGKLPLEYFRKWVAMTSVNNKYLAYMETHIGLDPIPGYASLDIQYPYFITIVNKGTERAYDRILEFFVVVDLSSNQFKGEIPEFIGTLEALNSLNLSNNMLTGHVPLSLVNLKHLEALDLSRNALSGEIPAQLSVLTSLSIFNVSHNNLTGPIPQGNQFGAFENNSFSDNPGLCGKPLSKGCGDTGTSSLPPSEDEDGESPLELNWEIVVIGLGSGLVIGVAFGWAMDTRKYEWLAQKKFATWRRSRRN